MISSDRGQGQITPWQDEVLEDPRVSVSVCYLCQCPLSTATASWAQGGSQQFLRDRWLLLTVGCIE